MREAADQARRSKTRIRPRAAGQCCQKQSLATLAPLPSMKRGVCCEAFARKRGKPTICLYEMSVQGMLAWRQHGHLTQ